MVNQNWKAALRDNLKFFLIQGMSESEAISLITHKNAVNLGINDQLGTIEVDKLASLVVWDKILFIWELFPKPFLLKGN